MLIMKISIIVSLTHLLLGTLSFGLQVDEPQCYSRFDYDYKIVQKMNQLENVYTELEATNNDLRKEVEKLKKNQGKLYYFSKLLMKIFRYKLYKDIPSYIEKYLAVEKPDTGTTTYRISCARKETRERKL